MKSFKSKKIVISGGSSGIGKALIDQLYQAGAIDFAVIGRDMEKLKTLKKDFPKANIKLFQGDVSKPENLRDFIKIIEGSWGGMDLLINNAGVVSAGALESISDEDIIDQININVTGLILLTKYSLPLLQKSDEAAIVNVSSGLGLIGMPFYTAYAATKGAVKQFSESLRRELKDFPIHVLTLYPTATDTPMMKSAVTSGMDTPESVAQKTLEGLKEGVIDVIMGDAQRHENVKLNAMHPEEFDKKAATMYEALKERTATHRSM